MAEPTSAYSFDDLTLEVAEKLSVATYGAGGDEAAQLPTDAHDLALCRKHVNNGIRMFIADSPPNGWRWMRPILEVTYWAPLGVGSGITITGTHDTGTTTVTASTAAFFATMETKTLSVFSDFDVTAVSTSSKTFTVAEDASALSDGDSIRITGSTGNDDTYTVASTSGSGPTVITADETIPSSTADGSVLITVGDFVIDAFVSSTVITLVGDQSWTGSKIFEIKSNATFTLPKTFGGQYTGELTFKAGTNVAAAVIWTSEYELRKLRENVSVESGDPRLAAVRLVSSTSRRWELMLYPKPDETDTVLFPYDLYFDSLTTGTDLHPAGYAFDEAIKAACFAAMERDSTDMFAGLFDYYKKDALLSALKIDARSAPKRLGYNGNSNLRRRNLRDFREYVQRPTITYNTP